MQCIGDDVIEHAPIHCAVEQVFVMIATKNDVVEGTKERATVEVLASLPLRNCIAGRKQSRRGYADSQLN